MNHKRRIEKLRSRLKRQRIDALIVSNDANVQYLTGFTGGESTALIGRDFAVLITDFRYTEQAEAETAGSGVRIIERRGSMWRKVAAEIRRLKVGVVGFEPRSMTVQSFDELRKHLRGVELKPAGGQIEALRACKSAEEVKLIREAIRIAERAFLECRPLLKVGVTEKDVADELEWRMRRSGAECAAFPVIVAFGERAALPHARPTDRKLRPDEMILIDWGARFRGYNCDLTRVLFTGRIPQRFRARYKAVIEAQRRAILRIKHGASAAHVFDGALKSLKRHRLGNKFRHGLGHGVGLCVHEEPTLSARAKGILRAGMVVTVEPGVYFRGWGGIRVEDMVQVTRGGCRVLTGLPRDLESVAL